MNINQRPAEVTPAKTSLEIELLLCCARAHIDRQGFDRIRNLAHTQIDWVYVVSFATRHAMLPLLYRGLSAACPEAVPQAILNHLRDHFYANALRMLRLTTELIQLLKAFAAAGIQAVPFKGPALAVSAYGSLALRHSGDLDILVDRRDVTNAKTVLTSHGYGERDYGDDCEQHFVREGGLFNVDLHWVIPRYWNFPLDPPRSWWLRREPISVAGTTVLQLAPEESLLILCVNSIRDIEETRLFNLCDVAEHIRAHPGLVLAGLLRQARKLRCERMVCISLVLAQDLLGTILPSEVKDRVQALPLVRELASQMREQLFQEAATPSFVQRKLWQLQGMDGLRDRACHRLRVLRNVARPNENDRAFLRLPASLSFLYYLIRPIRLLIKYRLGLFRRVWTKFIVPP
jgi:hypothetical protein